MTASHQAAGLSGGEEMMNPETPSQPGAPHLVVVPPYVPPSLLERARSLVTTRRGEPCEVAPDDNLAVYIELLEQRQIARCAHVAQIQKIIDKKQLELDNLKRRG